MDTQDRVRQAARRFKLSDQQLRALTADKVPELGPSGKVRFIPNPKVDAAGRPTPYRFLDDAQGAPKGFGVYVGRTGSTFEVARRVGERFMRFKIGSVNDLSIEQAHEAARQKLAVLKETGDNPRRQEKLEAKRESIQRLTVAGCFEVYLAELRARLPKGLVKQVSIDAVSDSLARLSRPEVGLAGKQVRDLAEEAVMAAWDAVRRSAANRSNRIPKAVRAKLAGRDDWFLLSAAELAALGVSGKDAARVRASGLAATEHTFSDAHRAVDLVLKRETREAARLGRPPDLSWNPFALLREDNRFRATLELRKHYRDAEVRNPLGEENGTLPRVLKTILARREEQGGHNRQGADYLLLTLIFGSRRSEAARLKWFDKCSVHELRSRAASWVWLGGKDEVNPHTKRTGPQVFFHDTKSGEERFLPLPYFAERILRRRLDERDALEAEIPKRVRAAEADLRRVKKETSDYLKIAKAQRKVEIEQGRSERLQWVFPARSHKAKSGHYSDSKSIIRNVRRDAGMLDLDKEIDIGLTPHDLRRTLGRYAGRKYSGPLLSQMLHHKISDGMSPVSERYTEQEWARLREAFTVVEEDMIATSPRVWNRLKGPDKPRLDEARDPPVTIFRSGKTGLDEEE